MTKFFSNINKGDINSNKDVELCKAISDDVKTGDDVKADEVVEAVSFLNFFIPIRPLQINKRRSFMLICSSMIFLI